MSIGKQISALLKRETTVHVKGLGVFKRIRTSSVFDSKRNTFLPPISYIEFDATVSEGYDFAAYIQQIDQISKAEADEQVELQVNALKENLDNYGQVKLDELGQLITYGYTYVFKPLDLSGFDFSEIPSPVEVEKTEDEEVDSEDQVDSTNLGEDNDQLSVDPVIQGEAEDTKSLPVGSEDISAEEAIVEEEIKFEEPIKEADSTLLESVSKEIPHENVAIHDDTQTDPAEVEGDDRDDVSEKPTVLAEETSAENAGNPAEEEEKTYLSESLAAEVEQQIPLERKEPAVNSLEEEVKYADTAEKDTVIQGSDLEEKHDVDQTRHIPNVSFVPESDPESQMHRNERVIEMGKQKSGSRSFIYGLIAAIAVIIIGGLYYYKTYYNYYVPNAVNGEEYGYGAVHALEDDTVEQFIDSLGNVIDSLGNDSIVEIGTPSSATQLEDTLSKKPDVAKVAEPVATSKPISESSEKRYIIVIGSHSSLKNAKTEAEAYNKKGHKSVRVILPNVAANKKRVIWDSYATEEQRNAELRKVRKDIEPKAWPDEIK